MTATYQPFMTKAQNQSPDDFVMQLINSHDQVFAYILSLTADRQQAHDVMQDVNCILLEKSEDFRPGTNFLAWAKKIAYFELLALRRGKARERLVFDDEMLGLLQQVHDQCHDEIDFRRIALRRCLEELPSDSGDLVRERYFADRGIQEIATSRNLLPNAVTKRLSRLRVILKDCIQRRVAGELA